MRTTREDVQRRIDSIADDEIALDLREAMDTILTVWEQVRDTELPAEERLQSIDSAISGLVRPLLPAGTMRADLAALESTLEQIAASEDTEASTAARAALDGVYARRPVWTTTRGPSQ